MGKETAVIKIPKGFDIWQTLNCGQCFRFTKRDDGVICGVLQNRSLEFKVDGDSLYINCEQSFADKEIYHFFDFERDYDSIKSSLSSDKTLSLAINYAGGIRILNQEPWEALCSFIISQNNNIKRISGIIERLCQNFGDKIDGGYSFPTAKKLSKLEVGNLDVLRSGFRAKYIIDAAKKVSSGEVDFEKISSLPLDEARCELMKIVGVGPKVADCALLFGFHRLDAFPTDVWIKRVLEKLYPNGFPENFKDVRGIAQQYLFHYARTNEDAFWGDK